MRKLPRKVLDDLWLIDFDLTESVTVVLDELRALPPDEADALSPAAQNMRRLLNMTADNVDLKGTKLEELISLSAAVGVPPARALAALMQIGVTDDAIPPKVVSETFLDELLGSHPAAQTRKGAIDAEHPDGLYPIAARSLPITLGDIVYSFESLPDRFGPASLDPDDPNALVHPGFVLAASGITEDAFTMYVRVNLNALPYKGVDLTTNYIASVNSTASQIHEVFDFTDPEWIRVEGLSKELTISEMTVRVLEDDAFIPGGDAREPLPTGNSPAWDLPPWLFERLIAEMARRRTVESIGPHCDEYKLGADVVAFEACVDDTGWTAMTTFIDVGNPPPPAYLWDLLSEVAQVRSARRRPGRGRRRRRVHPARHRHPARRAGHRHPDQGQPRAQPRGALIGITEQLNDNADGDADFYYFKPPPTAKGESGDYLYFVTEADLRKDADGLPARPYELRAARLFADPDLTDKRLLDRRHRGRHHPREGPRRPRRRALRRGRRPPPLQARGARQAQRQQHHRSRSPAPLTPPPPPRSSLPGVRTCPFEPGP